MLKSWCWVGSFVYLGLVFLGCGPTAAPPGTPLPPIQAELWINGEFDAKQVEGKVVVLEQFASWCGPCAEFTPELIEIYLEYRPRGVEFVALTPESVHEREAVENFVRQLHVPWPVGIEANETLQALESELVPTTFVFDQQGKLLWHSLTGGSLRKILDRAIQ